MCTVQIPVWVRQLRVAMARETRRYAMGGIWIRAKDGRATVAATDGRRLHAASWAIAEGQWDDFPPDGIILAGEGLMGSATARKARPGLDLEIVDAKTAMLGGVRSEIVEGIFPPIDDLCSHDRFLWAENIPDGVGRANVQPSYLADAGAWLDSIDDADADAKKFPSAMVHVDGPKRPLVMSRQVEATKHGAFGDVRAWAIVCPVA